MMRFSRQSAIRSNLELRAEVIHVIRQFFHYRGFLEIETPIRIPVPVPEANIDLETSGDWFLQPSPELCMKRLVATGYEKIYQICRCFRKGERGGRHVPEMTLLEWYETGSGYFDLMVRCEELVNYVAERLNLRRYLNYRGKTIDLAPPWDRITVSDAFDRFGSMSAESALKHDCFDEVMGVEIEPGLGSDRPLFLYDYPAERSSLARLKLNDSSVAERFELYIAGIELCNAFSELTDPVEQRVRFMEENRIRTAEGKDAYPIPELFLDALKDMPPAAGIALGIDRLVMLFANACSIEDVIAFVPEEL